MLMSNLIKNFKVYLLEDEKSSATVEKYIRDISTFLLWTKEKNPDKAMVLRYKEELLEAYAPASVNSVLSSLNSFFTFTGHHELKVRTVKIQKQLFSKSEKELTRPEYLKLLQAAKRKGNKRLYLLMQTICASGIRVSELKFITKEAVMQGRASIKCKGKLRYVFLPENLCLALKAYIKEEKIPNGAVFITKTGKPLDRSNIWKDMKNLCEQAGVASNKVFPHNLRHLFARTYYSVQKDIVRLADILGHSSVNTTRIYTMETGDIHRRQIQNLGLVHMLC